MTTTTLYAMSLDHIARVGAAGVFLVELRCETCDDVHRFTLDDEQLDAIRVLAHVTTRRGKSDAVRVAELLTREVTDAAADVVSAIVWQLTHTTAHAEAERREGTRDAH